MAPRRLERTHPSLHLSHLTHRPTWSGRSRRFLRIRHSIPVQQRTMALQFMVRQESIVYTDARAGILLELLGRMGIIKYFVYERLFLHRVETIRHNELVGIRHIPISKAAN